MSLLLPRISPRVELLSMLGGAGWIAIDLLSLWPGLSHLKGGTESSAYLSFAG